MAQGRTRLAEIFRRADMLAEGQATAGKVLNGAGAMVMHLSFQEVRQKLLAELANADVTLDFSDFKAEGKTLEYRSAIGLRWIAYFNA